MKISFDCDGTVFTQGTPELNYTDAEPIPHMIELLNQLFEAGHDVFLFTARHFKHFKFTEESFKKAGLKYTGLVMNKISCDLYVDDKGFRIDPQNPQDVQSLQQLIKDLSDVN